MDQYDRLGLTVYFLEREKAELRDGPNLRVVTTNGTNSANESRFDVGRAVAAIRLVGAAQLAASGGAIRYNQFRAVVESAVAGQSRSSDDRGWQDVATIFVAISTDSIQTALPAAARILGAVRGVCGSRGAYPGVSAYCGMSFGPVGFDQDLLDQAYELAEEAGQIRSMRPLCSGGPRRPRARPRSDFGSCLNEAVSNGEMSVVYQSIHGAEQRELVGFEALARWTSPIFGVVPPDQFIPVAEKSGAIHEIGEWVLETACRDLATFVSARHESDIVMSINASVKQLTSGAFPGAVAKATSRAGIDPRNVVIEVTESVFADQDAVGQTLNCLHELGSLLSLDDVGTGYASLSQLAALPIDWMKIDRSLTTPGRGYKWDKVLRSVVALGRALDMEVVAEGMESTEHIELARDVGCSMLQGFHLSLPESIDGIVQGCSSHWATLA